MSSLDSMHYYKDIKEMSRVRAVAETVMNNPKVRKINAAEAYEMAKKQAGVFETDLEIYPPYAKQLGLPKGAKVLNDCHGKIVGRTAKARRFYNKLDQDHKDKVEGDLREAMFQMEQYPLIKAEAVLGQDPDLMIKATFVTTESDAMNVFNWLCNFTPIEVFEEKYKNSKKVDIVDIILVAFNEWTCDDPFYNNVGAPQLALVDELHNVIFNFGMRYFGERKKGTLTLGWTSGMRLGMAACHGGIKEIDFTHCAEEEYKKLGKRSIAFFGLSGTGKSSHTNSHTNGDTLPKGFKKVVLHDDAFQIDLDDKICRAWEPTLFDKTDTRPIGHPDWEYVISLMNHSVLNVDGKNIPLGLDSRQANGRALFEREMLGETVDRCSFPKALCWLMKDTVLPPLLKFKDKHLAIAMGAALITKRNKAENVSAEDLKKLAFEPFANPFRVYDLWKDVEAFLAIADNGADFYSFNSQGLWKKSDTELEAIKLQTSLTLQSGILLDQLEWEDWDALPGAMIPTKESVDKILPGFYDKYNTATRENMKEYKELLQSRFQQRIDFLKQTDIATKPEMLEKLINALSIKA
ncbi:MAG TPA: phosphoenolpyruvate carboxykinase (ATP) [Candidatus Cloacimonadota bacterium]|nr:phosphoenolpyruvate carboxykinase (ATP) [Candidatus Cloacimonadota bacterium]HQB40762.1 phosphoenolpyruvate carboxykinase (ATP) [Candidatus Cloacimonadota bacterium]